jgi:hypothetical protein
MSAGAESMTPRQFDRFEELYSQARAVQLALDVIDDRGLEYPVGSRTAREFLMQKIANFGVALNQMLAAGDLDPNYINNCAVIRMTAFSDNDDE